MDLGEKDASEQQRVRGQDQRVNSMVGDGGPAFPSKANNTDKFQGMSLRDYFAATAAQGLLAHTCDETVPKDLDASDVSERAFKVADAMLAERNKKLSPPQSTAKHNK